MTDPLGFADSLSPACIHPSTGALIVRIMILDRQKLTDRYCDGSESEFGQFLEEFFARLTTEVEKGTNSKDVNCCDTRRPSAMDQPVATPFEHGWRRLRLSSLRNF